MTITGPFKLGNWLVQPTLNTLERDDQVVRVEPRYMDLLIFLAEHQEEVVNAEQIHQHVWAGMVVGDHAVYQGIARLRKALGDHSDKPVYIETVPKRGYRLLLPTVELSQSGTAAVPPEKDSRAVLLKSKGSGKKFGTRQWLIPGGMVLVVAVAAIILWSLMRDDSPRVSPPHTLAVLPFEMLDPESKDAYLAHGLSAELLTQLGKVGGLRVLGYISSSQFKPGDRDVQEIGQRLGADVLVLGGVRRNRGRIQVYIEVVDTHTGAQIWSQRFDQLSEDIFELEEDIADQVVASLGQTHIPIRTAYRTDPTEATLDAYDYYLLGRFHKMNRNKKSLEKALEMYHKAVETDHGFPAGYRGIAAVTLLQTYYGDLPLAKAVETALPNLEQALRLDPNDEEIYGTLGLARYLLGEYGVAEEFFEQALSLNKNYAIAWMWRGLAMEKQGQLQQATEYYRRAILLEPLSVVVNVNYALALQKAGHHDEAVGKLQAISDPGLSSVQYNRTLAGLSLQGGDLAAAYRHTRRALDMDPEDKLSTALLALILQDLGQEGGRQELFGQSLKYGLTGSGALETLEQIYIRMDHAGRTLVDERIGSLLPDKHDILEIMWRRRSAFLGLAHTSAARYDQAIEMLGSALRAGDYALDSTDFDLLYCTALTFSQQQNGQSQASGESLTKCERALDSAREQGWNSQWTTYVSVQIDILRERYQEAFDTLEGLYQKGFNGTGLLENDPLLAPIRQQPRYLALIGKMKQRAADAWAELSMAESSEP